MSGEKTGWMIDEVVLDVSGTLTLFLLVVTIAIFIHEMGHYLAARLFNLAVTSVTFGRGRVIKEWTDKRGVDWKIHLWPWGAHVRLSGMETAANKEKESFAKSAYWRRMAVIIAAPLANLTTPFILYPLAFILVGQPAGHAVVAGVEKGFAAYEAGVRPGDRFLSVDGVPIRHLEGIWGIVYSGETRERSYEIERDGKIIGLKIKPDWIEYEQDLIRRENARFGIGWYNTPYAIKSLLSVNGQDVKGKPDLARALLIENLGKPVSLGMIGPEDKTLTFEVVLPQAHNQGLTDKNSEDYALVYLGAYKGNYYLRQSVSGHIYDGLGRAAAMVRGVATLPFQLLPIDPIITNDPYAVTAQDSASKNLIFRIIHALALVSIFLGLFNLLPFPGLDGGHILIQTIEKIKGVTLTNKAKAVIFVNAFILIYATIAVANMDNLPRYIDSRLEKLHELFDQ